MPNDWLIPNYSVQLTKEVQSPRIVVLSFWGLPNHIRGVLSRFSGPGGASFLMVIPNAHSANVSDCGRLLGLALLEAETNLLQPTLMPFRMGTAFLRADGTFRHQLIRTFAPWVVEEVKRLEARLRNNHQTFLNSILQAVRGNGARGFQPPPPDFPLEFEPGLVFAIEPPPVLAHTSAFNRAYGEIERHKRVRVLTMSEIATWRT